MAQNKYEEQVDKLNSLEYTERWKYLRELQRNVATELIKKAEDLTDIGEMTSEGYVELCEIAAEVAPEL
jgi:hypothetical protein